MPRSNKRDSVDDRKIAVYARKSKITETGKSIEIQKEKCIQLACVQFNVDESDILVYGDEGKSGFYADRPQYRRMLRDIEENKIRAVICYKIDRISRRTVDLLNLVQQMEQKGISFVSVSDRELDTSTRTGKIMISLLSAIAEFERDIIAERITDNMYELAKEGRWLGGTPPLGYCSMQEKSTTGGKKAVANYLAPAEEGQRTVKRIFELFLKHSSLLGTATMINNEGHKTGRGGTFTDRALKAILQNPVYAVADMDMKAYFESYEVPIWAEDKDFDGTRGIAAYNKTEHTKELDSNSRTLDPKYNQRTFRKDITEWVVSIGKHEGIISSADWIATQNLLEEISKTYSARPREVSKSLLSGLIRCVSCGSRMFVKTESNRYNPDGTIRFRYVCDVKYRKKGGCEKSPNVKGYDLDHIVVEKLCNLSKEDDAVLNEFFNTGNKMKMKSQEIEKEIASLKKRINQIERDIQNQIVSLRSVTVEIIKQSIYTDVEMLHKELAEVQDQHKKLCEDSKDQDNQLESVERARKSILEFASQIKLVGYEGKLQLLRKILDCVIIKGNHVHIFLKGMDSDNFFEERKRGGDLCHIKQYRYRC